MTITISGTTGIAGVSGSAAAPTLVGDDPDTGLFFPAANVLAFATTGIEQLRIEANGQVTLSGNLQFSTGSLRFPDSSTQTTAGIKTGKAIAMAIVFS